MLVILTGAGVSAESGLGVFRGNNGLWASERIEDVCSPSGFARDPDRVFSFYNKRRQELVKASPNAAHVALARLEAESKLPVLVVTQNIDNLHEKAGTKQLLHMHGEALKARCRNCEAVIPWEGDLTRADACPRCGKSASLRPHVVWFEEMPLYMDEIETALAQCRIFISIGTSGNVYPAAGFASRARSCGARVVELNLEPSAGSGVFHEGSYGLATQVTPAWVEAYLAAGAKGE